MNPELSMFVDERMTRSEGVVRLVAGGIVVEHRRWDRAHAEARKVAGMRGKRRLDVIRSLLDRVGGFALLTYADLPEGLIPAGELDGTDDIPRMVRADNVWSQGVLALASAALACLRTSGVSAATIDLFYDPKSLTATHRAAFEGALRETLPAIAREDPMTHEVRAAASLLFRRVEPVPKGRSGAVWSQLQDGTAVAHHLCSQVDELVQGGGLGRIVVRNHTDALRSMITKFASIP